jgi:hypothetical protein
MSYVYFVNYFEKTIDNSKNSCIFVENEMYQSETVDQYLFEC